MDRARASQFTLDLRDHRDIFVRDALAGLCCALDFIDGWEVEAGGGEVRDGQVGAGGHSINHFGWIYLLGRLDTFVFELIEEWGIYVLAA